MYRLVGAPEWVYCLIGASFGLFFVAGGLFTALGAASNWEEVRSRPRVRVVVWLLGRTGARVFYVATGVALIAFGAYFVAGAMWKLAQSLLGSA
jgi:hypothetical protein